MVFSRCFCISSCGIFDDVEDVPEKPAVRRVITVDPAPWGIWCGCAQVCLLRQCWAIIGSVVGSTEGVILAIIPDTFPRSGLCSHRAFLLPYAPP